MNGLFDADLAEASDDAWEVLEQVRELWRDEDRPVDLHDEYRDEAA